MSGSVNKVTLVGKLGSDPECRSMNNDGEVLNFSLATSESWKDKTTGEKQEKTEWHKVVIFNEHLLKIAKDYLRKGSMVYLEGSLQTRKWQDNNGADRYSTEVVLQRYRGELTLLGDKPSNGGGQQQDWGTGNGTPSRRGPVQRPTGRSPFDSDLDDDVPFIRADGVF